MLLKTCGSHLFRQETTTVGGSSKAKFVILFGRRNVFSIVFERLLTSFSFILIPQQEIDISSLNCGPFCGWKMATGGLTLDSILDMTMEELGMQLINRGEDMKGLNKPERQKRLIRLLGKETEEVAPVEEERYGSRESVLGVDIVRVSSPVQSVGGLIRDEDFELHKLRLQVELEAKKMSVEETKLRFEMEEKRFRLGEKRIMIEELVSKWKRRNRQ